MRHRRNADYFLVPDWDDRRRNPLALPPLATSPTRMLDYTKLVWRHAPPSAYTLRLPLHLAHLENQWGIFFDEIALTLDVAHSSQLHTLGHSIRLRDARYPSMYVVNSGGSQDNRGYDPYDSTVQEGSYLVLYEREASEFQPAGETVGFDYEHIGFRLVFDPFEDDARGSAFILQHYTRTDLIVAPAPAQALELTRYTEPWRIGALASVRATEPFDRSGVPPIGDGYVMRYQHAPNGDIHQLTRQDFLDYGVIMLDRNGEVCLPDGTGRFVPPPSPPRPPTPPPKPHKRRLWHCETLSIKT
jgi:hypothetical protein